MKGLNESFPIIVITIISNKAIQSDFEKMTLPVFSLNITDLSSMITTSNCYYMVKSMTKFCLLKVEEKYLRQPTIYFFK